MAIADSNNTQSVRILFILFPLRVVPTDRLCPMAIQLSIATETHGITLKQKNNTKARRAQSFTKFAAQNLCPKKNAAVIQLFAWLFFVHLRVLRGLCVHLLVDFKCDLLKLIYPLVIILTSNGAFTCRPARGSYGR